MSAPSYSSLPPSAHRLLASRLSGSRPLRADDDADAQVLVAADLAARLPDGGLAITGAGRAFLARTALLRAEAPVDPFRGQHMVLMQDQIADSPERANVTVDAAESPLAWLARRKGRDGRALIEPVQLLAGERLRDDFTRAQMMPRVTADWSAPIHQARRSGSQGAGVMTEAVVAARQRVRRALDAVGPELAGLLLDVCCFLKRLEDLERERGWPARSAKVVLQLGLDRLARHYGFQVEMRGTRGDVRTWLAPDASFVVDGL